MGALQQLFTGSHAVDAHDYGAGYEQGGGGASFQTQAPSQLTDDGMAMLSAASTVQGEAKLPTARRQKLAVLEEMGEYGTLASAIDIHLAHALSVDKQTGTIFQIKPRAQGDGQISAADRELASMLMGELGEPINEYLPSWMRPTAVFGVSYVRPYAEHGLGIKSYESSYYTLPHHVREYVRGGDLAGFTNEYFYKPDHNGILLAAPWELIPIKIPYWSPSASQVPIGRGTQRYSLLQEPAERTPIETQNYGTSLIENCYEPWSNLRQSINALKASRANASRIDRILGVQTSQLDPDRAASYTRNINNILKDDAEYMSRRARQQGVTPTVVNSVIPIMGDGKGAMTIDTQMIGADIAHIEDIMFHMKQLCSSAGIDASMLGFSDMLAGGLGEGGFFRTAIQAAMRAQWLRFAAQTAIYRSIDLHLAYKTGKVYPAQSRPYYLEFNSLNTAIQEEENSARESQANFASMVVTVLDQMQNGQLAHSKTLKEIVLGKQFKFSDSEVQNVIKELAEALQKSDTENDMYESLRRLPASDVEEMLLEAFRQK
jgi:hypothetical protein